MRQSVDCLPDGGGLEWTSGISRTRAHRLPRGLTTVLFGFGGGFVTVPIITLVDADLGHDTARVAAATSALVMLVNAIVATVSTRRETLAHLKGRWWLLGLLGLGG